MWQTIAIALFLNGITAALSERPAPYHAAPALQRAPRALAPAVQPKESVKAADEKSQLVLLHLWMCEISLSKLRQLNIEGVEVSSKPMTRSDKEKILDMLGGKSGQAGGKITSPGKGSASFGVLRENDNLPEIVNALRDEGIVQVLAEPTLVTLSGRKAAFRLGGKTPIPVVKDDDVTHAYRNYDTMVDFHPTILKNNRIRLELRAEVAELDREHSVVIAGQPVPGLRTRSVDTACELKSGQMLVLSGLHQRQTEKTAADAGKEKTKKPGSEQPKAKSATEETVLLFTVKAEIVEPMDGKGKSETAKRAGDGGVIRK